MRHDMRFGSVRSEEAADDHTLAVHVRERLHRVRRECRLNVRVHFSRFSKGNRDDVVVRMPVFKLFHQADWFAVHDLAADEPLFGQDVAVDIAVVRSARSHDEAVREWIAT